MVPEIEETLRKLCQNHLLMNVEERKGSIEDLTAKSTYALFVETYESVKELVEERSLAKNDNDFARFQAADERLWQDGFAVLAFAIAEKIGWMKDSKPVPIQE
ncbi:hypothetical protein NDS46_31450 (plasmid) [Paenibacillus thiaminolyticus]|uniref:hypothetical protein n=1 Tax=Paenibacillus thiaminolyticus TaxID=49283 RepID=UPI00233041C2|nr:hypothetical protein [Paenibacillus thiaminolyticus]WCF11475.1 hypothetical protein NDS46_31450 [Paenibacillus thiaminolyticus]